MIYTNLKRCDDWRRRCEQLYKFGENLRKIRWVNLLWYCHFTIQIKFSEEPWQTNEEPADRLQGELLPMNRRHTPEGVKGQSSQEVESASHPAENVSIGEAPSSSKEPTSESKKKKKAKRQHDTVSMHKTEYWQCSEF